MSVLALDTCFGAVSAAVRWRDADQRWRTCQRLELRPGGHAERLMPMIADAMAEAGLGFTGLHRIAVTLGPGTFTGVRVGVAAARGLALASGLPVVATSSLAVMAWRARQALGLGEDRLLAVAVDARRDMVYAALFSGARGDSGQPLLLPPAEVAALIGTRTVTLVGSGARAVAAAVAGTAGTCEVQLPDLQPDALALAEMAADLAPVSPVRPLYLRPPDAKPQADVPLSR